MEAVSKLSWLPLLSLGGGEGVGGPTNLTKGAKAMHRKCFEGIVVYLKSPRRRRDQKIGVKCFGKYRCVPIIASSEARNICNRKMF